MTIPNLREAREVWWCEYHEAAGGKAACRYGHILDDPGDCRMVAKALVDPALAEWATSLFQECGQCKGRGEVRLETAGDGYRAYCSACNGLGQVLNEDRWEAASQSLEALGQHRIAKTKTEVAVLAFLGYEEGPR